jgi:hypothetical protein
MNNDTIRTVFTYVIAIIVLVGTGVLLRFPPPGIPPEALLAFLGVQVGLVMGYVFNERAASSAVANQPTVTTTAGPPAKTTFTPPGNGDVPEGNG